MFAVTVVTVLVLSTLGYRNRGYEVTEDAVVERRGLLGNSRTLPHDEVEDVHLTQTRYQGAAGVGTIRVNEDVDKEEGVTEDMRLRYVENPREVYEELIERSGGLTSGAPRSVAEPMPGAALQGLKLFFALAAVFLVLPAALAAVLATILLELSLPGAVLVFAVALIGPPLLWTAYVYMKYDGTSYEIYHGHVEKNTGSGHSAVAFDDVEDVKHDGHDGFGHVGLFDDEGDVLLSMKYLSNSEHVYDLVSQSVEDEESFT